MRERRQRQRISFEHAPAALFGTQRVAVRDVSLRGAAIQHDGAIAVGRRGILEATIAGIPLAVECEVVTCRLQAASGARYRSGLRFTPVDAEGLQGVKLLLTELALQEIDSLRRAQEIPASLSA